MHPLVRSHAAAVLPVRNLSRRRFMQGTGGLVLGIALGPAAARAAAGAHAGAATAGDAAFAPNAFVRIGTDGTVTVLSKHLEMGQGAYTGLATLLAEELDADWSSVRVEGAPANTELYKNLALGVQGTGGSTAIANSYEQMRRAGATARAMLVAAAARQWQVDPQSLTVAAGVVRHAASQRQAGFGELAEAAARLPVPDSVALKAPADFKLIGKEAPRRVDGVAKTDGTAIFTQDMKLPGMLVAMAAHPPRFGATVASFDASKAKAVPGVRHVVQFAGNGHNFEGVAVLADNTWAARTGRDALQVQWDDSKAFRKGSDDIRAQFREALGRPGKVAGSRGDVDAALAQAAKVIEAEYEVPYLAHAAMEPMNCLVQLGDGRCDIWNGEQFQTVDQAAVAKILGIDAAQVFITQLYAGGSFGRRASPHADYVVEAVSIAKAARDQGVRAPIKLVWAREDDMRGGYYRPLNVHRARIGLDAQGKLQAWHVRLAGQSIFLGGPFQGAMQDGIDPTSVEGQADLRYAVPNLRVESYTPEDIRIPVLWYRSVGHTHTAFSAEGLMDEAADAAGQDPVAYRSALLDEHPRHRQVLELAAERAGWNQPLAPGAQSERRGRGVALHESFNTIVAQVAEVTVKADGSFKVDRIVCALDCGVVVNPDVVRAQMEGGIGFGLSTALHGALTLQDGQVQQSNFHDYPILRINEMPAIEVHTVASTAKPTGVGEPGVPPVAPAVANALYAATGQRIRTLPFARQVQPPKA